MFHVFPFGEVDATGDRRPPAQRAAGVGNVCHGLVSALGCFSWFLFLSGFGALGLVHNDMHPEYLS